MSNKRAIVRMNPIIDKMVDVYGQEGFRFWFENQSLGLMIRRFDEPEIDLDDPDIKALKKLPWGSASTTNDIELMTTMAEKIDAHNIFIIGNAWGFSTFCLAEIFPNAEVDAIDAEESGSSDRSIQERFYPTYQEFSSLTRRIISKHYPDRVRLTIGYSPQDTPKAIRDGVKYDLVFIDAVHTNDAIVADFNGIKDYLSDKCIVLFHDTIICGLQSGMQAVYDEAKKIGFDHMAVDIEGSSFGMGIMTRGIR